MGYGENWRIESVGGKFGQNTLYSVIKVSSFKKANFQFSPVYIGYSNII